MGSMMLVSVLAVVLGTTQELASERASLNVLYIGDEGLSDRVRDGRSAAFERFLQQHFPSVETARHDQVDPAQIDRADVVLLDWHQNGSLEIDPSPLGAREDWTTPTVLLGSAGLNLARAWRVRGASG